MATPSHYPMSIGRIFSLGWSLFKYAWRQILAATAICLVPAFALMTAVTAAFSPIVNEWLLAAQTAQLAGQPPPSLPAGFDVAFFALFLATIVLYLASLMAAAAIIRITDASFRARQIGAREAVRDGAGRLVSLVAANLLFLVAIFLILFIGITVGATFLVGGGLAAFLGLVVIVGTVAALIFASMRASLVSPVVVVDRTGGADGLVRSWRLTSGSGWRVLGYLIVLALLSTALSLLLVTVPTLLLRLSETASASVAIGSVISGAGAILTAAVSPIVLTLLYYDLRWRQGETVPTPGGGETSATAPWVPPTEQPPFGPPPL